MESPWKRCSTVFKKIQHLNFTEYKIFTKAISYWESALPIMCPLDFLEILTLFMTIFWRVIKNNFKLIQIKYVRPSNSPALEGLQALNLRSGFQLSKKLFLFASVKTIKNDEKCFLFHSKSSFRSWDIYIFVLTFCLCICIKVYEVTDWAANDYNTNISQYLKK